MDQHIESFLADVSRSLGKTWTRSWRGVRVALAKCEAIFRLQEPKKRMRAKRLTPAARCAALAQPRSCSAAGERASEST